MNLVGKGLLAGVIASAMVPWIANAQSENPYVAPADASSERTLSDAEIADLIEKSRAAGIAVSRDIAEFAYVGGSQDAVETQVCCEPVQEEVTVEKRDEITESYFDAIVAREIIQPVERTIIQPVERQILQG